MIFRFPRTDKKPRYSGHKVINVRGTNGSGKTTIIRRLLDKYKASALTENGVPWAYRMNIPKVGLVFVLGRYETPTGGCDTIRTQDEVCRGIFYLGKFGHVLFEGLIISGIYGRWISLAKSMPTHKFIFAVLDTPLDRCIKRTMKRRATKKNDKPFNPKNLKIKHMAVQSSAKGLRKEGMDVRILKHKEAIPIVISWLQIDRFPR